MSITPHLPALFCWKLRRQHHHLCSGHSSAWYNSSTQATLDTHWVAGNSGRKQHFCQACPHKSFQFPLCLTSQEDRYCCYLSHSQTPALMTILWQYHRLRGDSGQDDIKAGRKILFGIFFSIHPYEIMCLPRKYAELIEAFEALRLLNEKFLSSQKTGSVWVVYLCMCEGRRDWATGCGWL